MVRNIQLFIFISEYQNCKCLVNFLLSPVAMVDYKQIFQELFLQETTTSEVPPPTREQWEDQNTPFIIVAVLAFITLLLAVANYMVFRNKPKHSFNNEPRRMKSSQIKQFQKTNAQKVRTHMILDMNIHKIDDESMKDEKEETDKY